MAATRSAGCGSRHQLVDQPVRDGGDLRAQRRDAFGAELLGEHAPVVIVARIVHADERALLPVDDDARLGHRGEIRGCELAAEARIGHDRAHVLVAREQPRAPPVPQRYGKDRLRARACAYCGGGCSGSVRRNGKRGGGARSWGMNVMSCKGKSQFALESSTSLRSAPASSAYDNASSPPGSSRGRPSGGDGGSHPEASIVSSCRGSGVLPQERRRGHPMHRAGLLHVGFGARYQPRVGVGTGVIRRGALTRHSVWFAERLVPLLDPSSTSRRRVVDARVHPE